MKYKIEKRTYYHLDQVGSDYDIGTSERYYIKYQKWFLGIIPHWVYVMERNCRYHLSFRSIEKAEEFAKKHTCKGITPDTETYQTVKEFEC
jgi:hypothetical protein